MYKTNATFNTNSLKSLLSVIVSINNYRIPASHGASASRSRGSSAILRGLETGTRARASSIRSKRFIVSFLQRPRLNIIFSALCSDPLPSQYKLLRVNFQTITVTSKENFFQSTSKQGAFLKGLSIATV